MGTSWQQPKKWEASAKRGAIVSKLCKEIAVAAKMGVPDPELNARLRAAVEAARKASVPRDTIERAIKKGAGLLDEKVEYELVAYEGFAPHRVPVIVECLTENKNRTAADIRVLFRKGQLGSQGAVAWMFDRVGLVEASHPQASLDLEAAAIEAGAADVEKVEAAEGSAASFLCAPEDLDSVAKALAGAGWKATQAELSYRPKSKVELADAARAEVAEFLNALDDCDDVHRVHAGI